MSRGYHRRHRDQRKNESKDRKEVRNKIKAGKLPRYLFGFMGQLKLMLKSGIWSANVNGKKVSIKVPGNWIPLTSSLEHYAPNTYRKGVRV